MAVEGVLHPLLHPLGVVLRVHPALENADVGRIGRDECDEAGSPSGDLNGEQAVEEGAGLRLLAGNRIWGADDRNGYVHDDSLAPQRTPPTARSEGQSMTNGKRERSERARKAARTRKRRVAAKKAVVTKRRKSAARKAVATKRIPAAPPRADPASRRGVLASRSGGRSSDSPGLAQSRTGFPSRACTGASPSDGTRRDALHVSSWGVGRVCATVPSRTTQSTRTGSVLLRNGADDGPVFKDCDEGTLDDRTRGEQAPPCPRVQVRPMS